MITFYATVDSDSVRQFMPDVPYMLPASSWARYGLPAPRLPAHVRTVAADSGGFVAARVWGDYRYTPRQYVDWLETFRPEWAATMDYCCELELAQATPERQARTTENARLFWREYRAVPWSWVPTIQGLTPADYRRHAREMRPLVEQMLAAYGVESGFRVGIGTLCRRASPRLIHEIVRAVRGELPEHTPLHLWGVKLGALQAAAALPCVVSADSAAWNGLFSREARERIHASGLSQRRYLYTVALPAYRAKVAQATSAPKQLSLF